MTLKEIAEEAGVSISTVSRVINKKGPHVARPELQNRIWEIISRTGYVPNESALTLKKGAQANAACEYNTIACLFARTPESINDPFFSRLARSVEAAAFKQDYHVQYSLTEIDMKQPEVIRNMADQRVRGVVILGRCDHALLRYLKQYFRYVSYTGLNPLDAKYDLIICDGREISKAAIEHLIGLGHRNIAYIGETDNENRFTGYQETLAAHGIKLNKEYVVNVPHSTENGYRAACQLMQKTTDVTALFCANDMTAIGAMRAMCEMGIRIPRDMSIMGVDDIEMTQYMPTKLTTVHVPVEEMGQTATKVLIDRINGGHTLHMVISLPFYIVERESCGKPPKTPWRYCEK